MKKRKKKGKTAYAVVSLATSVVATVLIINGLIVWWNQLVEDTAQSERWWVEDTTQSQQFETDTLLISIETRESPFAYLGIAITLAFASVLFGIEWYRSRKEVDVSGTS